MHTNFGQPPTPTSLWRFLFGILEDGMPQGLLLQAVVVLAKLGSDGGGRPPIARVAGELALSPSERMRHSSARA